MIILLSVYNAVFLLASAVIKGHPVACLAIAVLLSLIALFVIAWIDFAQKTNEEEVNLRHEQEFILNKIKDEYLKVHKMKKGQELLERVERLSKGQGHNPQGDHLYSPNKDFKKAKGVHFDYLTGATSKKEDGEGQPEGA